ncbi:nicotinate-nucleotide--dimethylbenzimidazole phosphoribosyltransferase [Streptomyces sp. NPDC014870]|uniref:nicotinate-nucleotide--dimethylbenzimidazole phosphoribosyltransferase n=1 Tax=Streptomyces sp. NPDC014870 TaxID=3364925 RepID=UPI0036FE539A
MTDTGQVPGEGLPENAGMVEQPGIPAPGAYTFLDPSEHAAEDDDLLLMPGAQGAWSEHQPGAVPVPPVAVPAPGMMPPVGDPLTDPLAGPIADALAAQAPLTPPAPVAHEPVATPAHGVPLGFSTPAHGVPVEAVTDHGYEPGILDTGAHEAAGRDSGSVDLSAVRVAPQAATPPPARRPLHMGPPVPETGGVVRSLADRGPAAPAPAPTPVAVAAPAPAPVQVAGPPTSGLEYLDVHQEQPAAPQLGDVPPQGAVPWDPQPQAPVPAETVGQFVPVEGTVPTTPHLAPTPTEVPEALVEEAPAAVPAPRDGGPAAAVPAPPAEEPIPEPTEEPQAAEVTPEPAAEPTQPEPELPVMTEPETPPTATELPTEPAPVEHVAEAPAATEPPTAEQPDTPPELTPEQPESTPEPTPQPSEPAPEQVDTAPEQAEPTPEPANTAPEPADTAPEPADTAPEQAESSPEPTPQPSEPVPEQVDTAPEQADTAPEQSEPVPEQADTAPEQAESTPEPTSEQADTAPEQAESTPEPTSEQADNMSAPAPAPAPAPAYDDAEREAVLRVMRERRDIRNGFRSDPIPHEVLLRVLEAAHTAPSVGHSQPWDFVVIRSAETRRTMHELAQRQREAYAKSLPKARAKQFKELKIEAILDTPVNIVVTADPTRGGRHTLGRYTQPQMAPYSSALAVENLWLAARAEGLGVGWVSFFDEREMVRTLGLPEHLEVVAYLCVGYVDEFPEEPELMQAGWSKRRPLSWVVHEETYGRRALPGEEPHDLLQETVSNIRPLDAKALGEAWERQKRMTKPAGALGMLEIISAQLSGLSRICPPPIPEPAAVAIFAGDHGVHAQGVTAWPQEVTGQMVANFLGGGAVCNAFANQVGAEVCVIDVGVASDLPATPGLLPRKVRPGTGDFTTGQAMTREEALAAIEVGIETARDLVAAGNKALLTGEMGIANTTASAALISVYTGVDPVEVTGRGTGINDEMHARKVDVVRRALDLHKPDPADPIGVLSAIGGLEHAALVGLILGAASLRVPVVLDGVSTGAAALVARAIAPESLAACIAGHRSAEPGHVAALNKLGLRPLVDLDLRLGEGTGALLALPIVQSAARAMHEVATFDSAGVTEK